MNHATAVNTLHEASVRISGLVWLAGAIENFADDDFFEDVILDAGESYMHESMKVFADAPEWALEDPEEFLFWLHEASCLGFVVHAQTPVPTDFSEESETYHASSWGYTSGTYFYVEDLSEVPEMAAAWQKELFQRKREKWLAERAA